VLQRFGATSSACCYDFEPAHIGAPLFREHYR
jgi:hypothetical protein